LSRSSALQNNISIIYRNKTNYPKAIEYALKSLRIKEKIKEEQGVAYAYNTIGSIYKTQGNINEALYYYNKSLAVAQKRKDKELEAVLHMNIASCLVFQEKYSEAFKRNTLALKLYKELGDRSFEAECYFVFGDIYEKQGDNAIALQYYNRSLSIKKELGDAKIMAACFEGISGLFANLKQYEKALAYSDSARQIFTETQDPISLKNCYNRIAQIYAAMKQYPKAWQYQEMHNHLNDSIEKSLKDQSLLDAKTQLEVEKKESEFKIKSEQQRVKNEEEKKRQRLFTYAITFILLLVSIFSFLLFKRFKLTSQQKKVIEAQKYLVEEKQKEILDSINYAKRIQETLITSRDFFKEHLNEHFIFFKPKDIVSGDFYWGIEKQGLIYLAVCDSTGHGVPGAFMSLLNIGFINEAINEQKLTAPNEIFNTVRKRLEETISKEGQKDGFDGILVCIDKARQQIRYAAANNAPVLVSNGHITELAKDRMPVGKGEKKDAFALHTIHYKSGDVLFLYTDGYADQFGGPKGKKFMYKPLNNLLLETVKNEPERAEQNLNENFEAWKGLLEQVDDVCIMGIRLI
jgi:serine phosphatase RsbU (regulator of sigma subunit)